MTTSYCQSWIDQLPAYERDEHPTDNVLDLVCRLVNVVGKEGDNYRIQVGGGKYNNRNVVVIPNVVSNADLHCGDAIVGTAALRHLPVQTERILTLDPRLQACAWANAEDQAIETILEESPGFRPYLRTRHEIYYGAPPTCSADTPDGRALLLQYYLLSDRLAPGQTPPLVQEWLKRIRKSKQHPTRLKTIEKILDLDKPPTIEEQIIDGSGEGGEPGDSGESQAGDTPMSQSSDTPEPTGEEGSEEEGPEGASNPGGDEGEETPGGEGGSSVEDSPEPTTTDDGESSPAPGSSGESPKLLKSPLPKTLGLEASSSSCRQVRDVAGGGVSTTGLHKSALLVIPAKRLYVERTTQSYKQLAATVRPVTEAISQRVVWPCPIETLSEYGLRRGRLDEGGLTGLCTGDGVFYTEHPIKRSKLVVGLLLDMSGSMSANSRDQQLMLVTIALYEALSEHVQLLVCGHSTEGKGRVCMIDLITPPDANPENLRRIQALGANYDGWALGHFHERLKQWYPNDPALIFLISDGRPNGAGCSGVAGILELSRNVQAIKGTTPVIGIGIDNAYDDEFALQTYGQGRYIILQDVMSSGYAISSFLLRHLDSLVQD